MHQLLRLRGDRLDNRRVAVTELRDRDAGEKVEVLVALRELPVRPLEHDGRLRVQWRGRRSSKRGKERRIVFYRRVRRFGPNTSAKPDDAQNHGTGKTSLCAHLSVEADRAGDGPVYVIDTDPQGTLSTWHESRAAETPEWQRKNSIRISEGHTPAAFRPAGHGRPP